MKHFKLMTTCCAAALALTAANAYAASSSSADNNWYAGIGGGLTWPNHADMGGGGGINVGYRLAPADAGAFRVEAEAAYHSANGDNGFGDLRYFNYMGNVYYDFSNTHSWTTSGWNISPYIGAGAGLAEIHRGNGNFATAFHHNTNAFAYQGMAGLTFASASMPSTDWVLGYRYLGTDRENGQKLSANNVEIGLRYNF